ncbi:MAG: SurA N-terminal domain-containing protein [Nitrospinae bacterium]|nr:SurA N-terminal domain-containing protein [Nitrospinota bacterium]
MLQFMRDYAKSWFIKIMLWTVVASFVGTMFLVWGMGKETSAGVVATVDGKKIIYTEYQEFYKRILDFYKKQQGNLNEELFAPIVKKAAIDSLITRKLQLSIAKKEGLVVIDEEVIDEIQGMDVFKKDGRFDKDLYIRILQANRMNPGGFEDAVREDLLVKKVENLIKDGVKISKKEVKDAYARANEKVDVDYLILSPSNFINRVTFAPDKIEEFYNNNKSLFQRGEEMVVEYIAADSKGFEANVKIEDNRVNEYYNGHINEYKLAKRVKAGHILIAVSPEADEKAEVEGRAKAVKVLQELKGGGDFAELAKKYSDDPNKGKGGDLGFFSKGQMVKQFEDAAFALKEGEPSEPVRTPFGYHIIKVEKIEDERTKGLSEVRDDIVKILKDGDAKNIAKTELDGIRKGADLKSADFNTVVKGKQHFTASGGGFKKDDREHPVLSKAAFALKRGDVSEILEDGGKFYILKYKEKKDAFIPKFEEIKGEVEKAYRDEEAKKIVDLEAGKILEDLKKGKEFKKAADELKAMKGTTGYVTRNTIASSIGRDENLVQTVFNTKKGDYNKVKLNDNYFLVYIKDRLGIDEKKFQEEEKEFTNRLLTEKQNYTYQQWIENTKKTAEETGRIKITKGFI